VRSSFSRVQAPSNYYIRFMLVPYPPPMEEALPRREQNLVREQTNDKDHSTKTKRSRTRLRLVSRQNGY
jgi:hypothetical protein